MGFPIIPVVGALVKVVSKLLPEKPREVIEQMVTEAVLTDKDIMKFYLQWFGEAKDLPKWALGVKNLWRPFLATTYGLFTMFYYIFKGTMPDKYFCLLTISVVGVFGISRGVEKIKKHIV